MRGVRIRIHRIASTINCLQFTYRRRPRICSRRCNYHAQNDLVEAESVQDGDAGRIGIKDWSSPIMPSEDSGNILDIPSQQKEGEWFVFGIIPASENIADGLNVLEIWHQPITITGYVVESGVLGTGDEKCDLAQSSEVVI